MSELQIRKHKVEDTISSGYFKNDFEALKSCDKDFFSDIHFLMKVYYRLARLNQLNYIHRNIRTS